MRSTIPQSPTNPLKNAKRMAARKAVDEYVRDNMIVGIGSGSTIVYAIERLSELVRDGTLTHIECIPTSFQAKQLLQEYKLSITSLDEHPVIDVAIDGADEVDSALNCIKGGGGCQLQEKIVAYNSKVFVIVADSRKKSTQLGEKWTQGVPIEVSPVAYVPIMKLIEQRLEGESVLRMAQSKVGPVVTDNGNFILDTDFGRIENPQELHDHLVKIPGVIGVGLFCGMAQKAFFGEQNGSVTVRSLHDEEYIG
ncbi:hypothetical protein ABG067_002940 [Albugo candida]